MKIKERQELLEEFRQDLLTEAWEAHQQGLTEINVGSLHKSKGKKENYTIDRPSLPTLEEYCSPELPLGNEGYNGEGNPSLAAAKQVGGSHYQLPIQPIDYITKNNIPYREANIIKYVTRYKNKNGLQDLEKAKHYLEMLIEEYK